MIVRCPCGQKLRVPDQRRRYTLVVPTPHRGDWIALGVGAAVTAGLAVLALVLL